MSQDSPMPVEIFYHIFENLPRSALTSAARANSAFHDLSEKLIYRRLDLSSTAQAIQCCQTILQKPAIAQAVKVVVVMINDTARNPQAIPAFAHLLSSALKTMSQITSLHLAIEGPFAPLLDRCHFPHLTTFSSIVDLTPTWAPPMAHFLHRHPSITHLCLGGELPGQPFALPPGALPALQTFMGSRRLAPALVPSRPVDRVTLAWHAANLDLEIDCVVPALAQSAVLIRHFSCATLGWSALLIRTVAAYLPTLHTMRMHNISADYKNEAELFATLTDTLASFPDLVRLEVPCRSSPKSPSILTPDSELAALVRWQQSAPKLNTLAFPSGHVWQRKSNGAWAPAR